MCFDNESQNLAIGTINSDLTLLNMEHLAYTKFNQKGNSKVNCIKFSPFYTNYLGCGFENGSIKIFDLHDNSVLNEFKVHEADCTGLTFSNINKLLFCSSGMDGKINFFDIQAKKYFSLNNL